MNIELRYEIKKNVQQLARFEPTIYRLWGVCSVPVLHPLLPIQFSEAYWPCQDLYSLLHMQRATCKPSAVYQGSKIPIFRLGLFVLELRSLGPTCANNFPQYFIALKIMQIGANFKLIKLADGRTCGMRGNGWIAALSHLGKKSYDRLIDSPWRP